MRGVILAAFLMVRLAAAGEPVHVWFDARMPYARPLVRGAIAGRPVALVLDTGSSHSVLGLAVARASGLQLAPAPPFFDYLMHRREAQAIAEPLQLESGARVDGLSASDWGDVVDSRAPGGPHADGVLSPQSLSGVVLIDFLAGTLEEATWDGARDRQAPLLPVGEARLEGGHYVITAQVGDRPMRLAVDTGAPHSLIYLERSDEAPDGLARVSFRSSRLRVGPLMRDLGFELLEPLGEPGLEGLIGMDVLRDCVLALDGESMQIACRAQPAGPGGSAQNPLDGSYRRRWLVGEDNGPVLEEHVNGDLEFFGQHVHVIFRPDGRIVCPSFLSMRCPGMDHPAEWDEMVWLVDKTAKERGRILTQRFIRQSLDRLPRHLAAVWRDRRWSAAERRRILFALWDEAAEPDDRELAAAGHNARRAIERFVRRELPPGSADAFTVEELALLNARRGGGEQFRPYGRRPGQDHY
jgi:hypothetical protein